MPVRGASFLARPLSPSPSPLAADSLSCRYCLHCLGRSRDAVLSRARFIIVRDATTLGETRSPLHHHSGTFQPVSSIYCFLLPCDAQFFPTTCARAPARRFRRLRIRSLSFSPTNRTWQERGGADYDRRSKGGRGKRNEQTPHYERCRREICAKSKATKKRNSSPTRRVHLYLPSFI